jgi:hypothetical protein
MKKQRRLAKVVLATAIVGMVSAASFAVGYATSTSGGGAKNRGVILILGDSNTALGGKWPVWDMTRGQGGVLTADHLDSNYVVSFIAHSGAGIRTIDCPTRQSNCSTSDFWKLKLGATFTQLQPDAIVAALGIMDAFDEGTPTTRGYSNYTGKIDWFMNLIPKTTKVFWPNVPCNIEPTEAQKGCAVIDYSLALRAPHWPNLKIIDWGSVANGHPEYMDSSLPENLRVHYNDTGFQAWATTVTAALDAVYPQP